MMYNSSVPVVDCASQSTNSKMACNSEGCFPYRKNVKYRSIAHIISSHLTQAAVPVEEAVPEPFSGSGSTSSGQMPLSRASPPPGSPVADRRQALRVQQSTG